MKITLNIKYKTKYAKKDPKDGVCCPKFQLRFWNGRGKIRKKQIKDQKQYFLATFGSFLLTFLNFSELRSSCPESDFLLGLLFPDEDIIGCRRFQSLDEFTTSWASCKKTWKVIETISGLA